MIRVIPKLELWRAFIQSEIDIGYLKKGAVERMGTEKVLDSAMLAGFELAIGIELGRKLNKDEADVHRTVKRFRVFIAGAEWAAKQFGATVELSAKNSGAAEVTAEAARKREKGE